MLKLLIDAVGALSGGKGLQTLTRRVSFIMENDPVSVQSHQCCELSPPPQLICHIAKSFSLLNPGRESEL